MRENRSDSVARWRVKSCDVTGVESRDEGEGHPCDHPLSAPRGERASSPLMEKAMRARDRETHAPDLEHGFKAISGSHRSGRHTADR